jgi:acetyl-CoA synthetase
MSLLYKEFVEETFGPSGEVTSFKAKKLEKFNFAYDVVDRLAKDKPEKLAMVWCNEAGDEKFITFAEMKRESDRAASFFQSLGIKKGDVVMLILKRHYEFWYCFLALHKIGAVAAPATNQLMGKDLVYRFNTATVKAVVCTADGQISSLIDQAQPQCATVQVKVLVRGRRDGWESLEDGMARASKASPFIRPSGDSEPKVHDMMLMYFSSGTTGMPKMVAHDYLYPLGHIPTAVYWQNVQSDGLHLTVSETGWAKSMWGKIYGQWLAESAIFVFDFDRFNGEEMLKRITQYKVTTFCAPPTIYRFLIKQDLSRFDLTSLRYAVTAGEALNAEVYTQFLKATGLKIMEGFGQTETTILAGTFTWMQPKAGSMGRPQPGYDVRIVDENGEAVGPGVVGEICVKAEKGEAPAGMLMEYWRDPARTEQAWHDGLYHTGDTAWADEDGYITYVSRVDDIIKSSGYRIGPFEVESVIMEHPAVMECAVTGIPDPDRGQVVKATIVLAKGYQPSDDMAKEIQDYVKTHTAPYKYPRAIEFVPELPKTISGKIRRTEIRAKDWDK